MRNWKRSDLCPLKFCCIQRRRERIFVFYFHFSNGEIISNDDYSRFWCCDIILRKCFDVCTEPPAITDDSLFNLCILHCSASWPFTLLSHIRLRRAERLQEIRMQKPCDSRVTRDPAKPKQRYWLVKLQSQSRCSVCILEKVMLTMAWIFILRLPNSWCIWEITKRSDVFLGFFPSLPAQILLCKRSDAYKHHGETWPLMPLPARLHNLKCSEPFRLATPGAAASATLADWRSLFHRRWTIPFESDPVGIWHTEAHSTHRCHHRPLLVAPDRPKVTGVGRPQSKVTWHLNCLNVSEPNISFWNAVETYQVRCHVGNCSPFILKRCWKISGEIPCQQLQL